MMKGNKMTYGYIRISTDKQSMDNQKFEILEFAKTQNLIVDKWIKEVISGTKSLKKRELGHILKNLKANDILIASELSRLGRNLLQIMSILHYCMEIGAKIWTIKDNYRLGDDIQSKVLAFAFGLSAEIERNLISQRTKEALKRKREEGVVLGRPKGSKGSYLKLTKYQKQVLNLKQKGVSNTKIGKRFGVTRDTVARFLKYCKQENAL